MRDIYAVSISAFASLIFATPVCASDNEPITKQTIIAAWTERQSRVTSFDFAWNGPMFEKLEPPIFVKPSPKDKKLPDSINAPMRLVCDKSGRLRLEETDIGKTMTDVFDGTYRKTLFHPTEGDFPNAHIGRKGPNIIPRNIRTIPIFLIYRPLERTMGRFDPAKVDLTSERGLVDELSCPVLRQQDRAVWVDPTREFLPVRYYEFQKGKTVVSIEIKYQANANFGWVPSSWREVCSTPDGNVFLSVNASVTAYDINVPISDKDFDIQYPTGTLVHDYITNEEYIIRAGGTRRPILPGELTETNYQELLHSDPPGTPRHFWFRPLFLVAAGLLVAIVAGTVFYRRSARSTRASA
jgi:hypothetical protein